MLYYTLGLNPLGPVSVHRLLYLDASVYESASSTLLDVVQYIHRIQHLGCKMIELPLRFQAA